MQRVESSDHDDDALSYGFDDGYPARYGFDEGNSGMDTNGDEQAQNDTEDSLFST